MERRDLAFAAGVGVAAAVVVQSFRRVRRRFRGASLDLAGTGGMKNWRAGRLFRRFVASGGNEPLRNGAATDAALTERVVAAVRLAAPAAAVSVAVYQGQVTLSGPVPRASVQPVLDAACVVEGIQGVENALDVSDSPEPTFSVTRRPAHRVGSPGTRMAVGVAGAALCAAALRRFGLVGIPAAAIGAAAVSGAVANRNLPRLLKSRLGNRRVELFETTSLRLPAATAHQFWSRFENLPTFLSHVADVRPTGENEWSWTLGSARGRGPTWTAWVTDSVPGKVIAWESEPESRVAASGVVDLEDEGGDSTRLSIRLSYAAAAGAPRFDVRGIFGRQPGTRFREDVQRIKTYLETGQLGRAAAQG